MIYDASGKQIRRTSVGNLWERSLFDLYTKGPYFFRFLDKLWLPFRERVSRERKPAENNCRIEIGARERITDDKR